MLRGSAGAEIVAHDQLGIGGDRLVRASHPTGEHHVVGDVRIDNREEIARLLGVSRALPDLQLFARWLDKLGVEGLDAVYGDYSFIAWNTSKQQLIVGRAPLSEKALFLSEYSAFSAAATTPMMLRVLPGHRHAPDFRNLAIWAAELPIEQGSLFEAIRPVGAGEVVRLSPGGRVTSLRQWRLQRRLLPFRTLPEAGEELRRVLDQAVADACGRAQVAAELSGGRDSNAVASSAALHLAKTGRRLHALTGVPMPGQSWLPYLNRVSDEGPLAEQTAELHRNIDHQRCFSRGVDLAVLSSCHALMHHPWGNPSNIGWGLPLYRAAQACGAEVLLGATAGNLTISAHGRHYLGDVAREDGIRNALYAAVRSIARPRHLASAAYRLAQPLLPMFGRGGMPRTVPVLRQPYRGMAEKQLGAALNRFQAGRSVFDWRAEQLQGADNIDLLSRPRWGYTYRDPTADRRVVELCLGMPASFLIPTARQPVPLYAVAFGARLPSPVVKGERRGYQGADWWAQFPVHLLLARFQQLFANPLNAELFDTEFILRAVVKRPVAAEQLVQAPVLYLHRNQLLNALALADWIDVHFPR